jgi:hypothetical protein
MGAIKLLTTPILGILRFPLVQLAAVVAAILLLQAAAEFTLAGQLFLALDALVTRSVEAVAAAFNVKSFTRSWLTTSFWIGYVYLIALVLLFLVRLGIRLASDAAGRWNVFWLRTAIARERGIDAYRAWEPLERIRPDHISQAKWEEMYAWPASGEPPYPPLAWRIARAVLGYTVLLLVIAGLLQVFTPVPALQWLLDLAQRVFR